MANLGFVGRAYKERFEDWTGPENIATSVADGVGWLSTADTGGTVFIVVADAQGPIAQGALDGDDNDMMELAHHMVTWSAQHGELYGEWRVKVSVGAIADVALNVGFNDDALEDSNTLPVELSTTTFTSNAASFVGVVFDADATNDDFHAFAVDDDADISKAIADLRFSGIAPVLDEWFGVAIRITDAGSGNRAIVEINVCEESTGRYAQKRFTDVIDRDVLLTPYFGVENRAGTAHTAEVDYIYVRQSRSAT